MSKFQIFLIVLYLFFFGAVGGWVLELLFRRFFSGANPERKWLNPGFLFGPCLPLYGFGTVLLFILSELDHQLFGSFSGTFWYYPVMFVVMALAMTLLEYIVGVVSFKGFHLRLWDYSKLWGNIQGIICPLFTFFWGVIGAAYYIFIHPMLINLVNWMNLNEIYSFFIGIYFGIFIIDVFYSFNVVNKIRSWAKENNVIVKLEEFKLSIKLKTEKIKQKYNFLLSFKSKNALRDELNDYNSQPENRTE